MKEEEFKKIIKESIFEKAPEGISDRIMDQIIKENSSKVNAVAYSMPGKRLIIFLSILFSGSILWTLINSPKNNSKLNEVLDSISFTIPAINFNEAIFNSINVYLMVAFLAFLSIEYFALRRKSFKVF